MFRINPLGLCAAAQPGSLTGWLARLSSEASALPAAGGHDSEAQWSAAAAALWLEIDRAATHAYALRETDSLLSLFNCLCGKGWFPPAAATTTAGAAAGVSWASLAERLLAFSSVEATSVLSYPGIPESTVRGRLAAAGAAYAVPCSRETLLLTGGLVPLSARIPCEDGAAVNTLLTYFCNHLEISGPSSSPADADAQHAELADMNRALVTVLTKGSRTIRLEAVAFPVARYMAFLYECDTAEGTSAGAADASEPRQLLPLLPSLARALCSEVAHAGLGARLTAVGLAYIIEQGKQASLAASEAAGGSVGMQHILFSQQFFALPRAAQALQLQLMRGAAQALYKHYERSHTSSSTSGSSSKPLRRNSTPLHEDLLMAPLFRSFYDFVDAVFQYDATHGGCLDVSAAAQQETRSVLSLATLRALRVEATAPDQFLRQSMEVVDRCASSMAVEGELIAGKVALFDYFDLNEEGKAALYEDIVTSLRHLVDLRPRNVSQHGFEGSSLLGASAFGAGASGDGDTEPELAATGSSGDDDAAAVKSAGQSMDPTSRRIMQAAHERVIRVLCDSLDADRINEAYGITVAHKYHGLVITKEVIKPLLTTMSRRGDCRVFNLVDVCVLYSDSTVDMECIACLFRACAVAGDHYRARTLLELLEDIVPGFLVKAPAEVRESLKDLRVLPPEPMHLFMSDEEKLVRAALAGGSGAGALPEPAELPSSA